MYGFYIGALVVGIYLAPGLALIPRAAFDSRIAYAVPVVSVLIVTLLARILKEIDLFINTNVLWITIIFLVTSAWRLYKIWPTVDIHWPTSHRLVYLISFCVALTAAAKLGVSSFEIHDEIYSWNLWAIQHTRGENHDLFFTVAPYPQTFPYLISWSYQLLGSIDLQSPVKCSFFIFTASLVAAIGTANPDQTSRSILWSMAVIVFVLFAAELSRQLARGHAETLMVPALVVSVALYLQDRRSPCGSLHLWLSSVAAVVAGLSKQPALIWLVLALPFLSTVDVVRRRRPYTRLIPVAISCCCGLLWMATEGDGFMDNQGVIGRSMENRSWLEQLLFVPGSLMGNRSGIIFVLILCCLILLYRRTGRDVFFCLIIPSLLLWFLFGAYGLRLGLHIVAIAALLIAANGIKSSAPPPPPDLASRPYLRL